MGLSILLFVTVYTALDAMLYVGDKMQQIVAIYFCLIFNIVLEY